MSHTVPALGAALATAAGCVWYVPALADLRAGADRPVSRRTAAAACLTGWSTAAVVAAVLFAGVRLQAACVMAVAGATVAAALRIRAAAQHRREVREIARHFAAPAPGRPGHGRSRHAFAALLFCGLAAAVATAALLVAAGPEDGADRLAAAAIAPAAVVGLTFVIAVTYAGTGRRGTTGGTRSPR
ncbi:hypothetical protein GCM10010269_35110 [Streptomyces humidus]|uniref:Uncharacterized protein n=1 Tax=Streptomyces humidus TaxID=52259 RepID=A0A918L438_9ACTN|nr:hypothetical protein [Streptomyces humidus]GGR93036.1 hypothetical protein GCM10010269_35110 [Streptomyces humidus]